MLLWIERVQARYTKLFEAITLVAWSQFSVLGNKITAEKILKENYTFSRTSGHARTTRTWI
jgi:hypothetical protein